MRCVVGLIVVVVVGSLCASCTDKSQPPQEQKKPVTILSPPVSAQPMGTQGQSKSPQRAEAQRESQQRLEAKQQQQQQRDEQRQQQTVNASVTPQVPAGAPAPPKGAQYTIFCARIEGPAHVERAKRIKDELMSRSGLNGWYVVHEERQTLLYHGFYRSISDDKDKKETARAQADLKRCKSLSTDDGRLFRDVMFVTLEAPDPVAPPDWNLTNSRGVWTIQIAAYKDSPLRKEAAVDAVREARKQGVEAYYYHGDTISSVCIGAWPEEAVIVHDAAKAVAPQDEKVLVAGADMPDIEGLYRESDVKVVKERVEVKDQTLFETMRKYPHHAVNGELTVRIVNGREHFDPSLLIRIPEPEAADTAITRGQQQQPAVIHQQGDLFGTSPSQSLGGDLPPEQRQQRQQQQPKKQPPPPPPPEQPGLGKLKSVDG
jgi:hypothetical protein